MKKIIIYFVMITGLFVMFVSCERDKSYIFNPLRKTNLALEDTLTIAYQETIYNNEEKISITFDSLKGESRCPMDVVCVWEGNAEVLFRFAHEEDQVSFSLNSNPTFRTDTTVFDFTISLLDVLPYPHTQRTYTEKDYSVKVKISR
jgi:hypothetical protein